jgi:4-carboxymuconolactone decarboxylase
MKPPKQSVPRALSRTLAMWRRASFSTRPTCFFHELWLRPALAPRDRSLVTVSAVIASGQSAQITYHLNRAMDNGLTKAETSEVLAHLAFYAGWPNVFSALPVVKTVFEKRPS